MSNGFGPNSTSGLFNTSPSTLTSLPPLFPSPYQPFSPFSFLSTSPRNNNNNKLKRARQRVDAGEPRNNYSSIPTYPPTNSTRPTMTAAGGPFSLSPSPANNFTFGQNYSQIGQPDGLSLLPQMQSAWFRLQQQALAATAGVPRQTTDNFQESSAVVSIENGNDVNGDECKTCDENEPVNNEEREMTPTPSEVTNEEGSKFDNEEKDDEEELDEDINKIDMEDSPKSKRKQYQPQQVEPDTGIDMNEDKIESAENDEPPPKSPHLDVPVEEERPGVNNKVQELLSMQRQWYVDWLAKQQEKIMTQNSEESPVKSPEPKTTPLESPKDLKSLGQTLKTELISNLSTTVDKIVDDYLQQAEAAARLAAQQQQQQQQRMGNQPIFGQPPVSGPRPFYLNPFYPGNFPYAGNLGFATVGSSASSIFPNTFGNYMNATGGMGVSPTVSTGANQTRKDQDPYSLVMPRKKRSKVTDTRLSKMPVRGDGASSRNSPIAGYFPPTMVGHPLYGATFAGLKNELAGMKNDDPESPANSDDVSDIGPYDSTCHQSYTLTPMHLRKAKLMFFFTRYPSSALLKTYFPDILFNKNNTAQLVKWFSNFREFYYIQMEKYARQALAEGIRRPEDIQVTYDDEIYKILNQHYNRNNHITVPTSFRGVVEATLREFFLAVQAVKDTEPSWKKQIYKVIQRLDDTIPEYFKNPNFLDQLE